MVLRHIADFEVPDCLHNGRKSRCGDLNVCEGIRIHGDALQQIVELPAEMSGIRVKKFMTLSRLTFPHTNVILPGSLSL